MGSYPAGTITGKDEKIYEIFVTDTGAWKATVGTKELYLDSRAALKAEIEKLTKRAVAKVDVPFTKVSRAADWQGGAIRFTEGTATGIHSANGNVLATFDRRGSTMKEQITESGVDSRTSGTFFVRLEDEERETLRQLVVNKRAADKAYRQFLDEYGLELKTAVTQALDNAKE